LERFPTWRRAFLTVGWRVVHALPLRPKRQKEREPVVEAPDTFYCLGDHMESVRDSRLTPRTPIDKKAFLEQLEDMLQLDRHSLKGPEALEDYGWDSLSTISFQALLDDRFGIRMNCAQFLQSDTFDKLFQLVVSQSGRKAANAA